MTKCETYLPYWTAFTGHQSGDTLMNELYRNIGAYICVPPIAMPINDKNVSTIWKK